MGEILNKKVNEKYLVEFDISGFINNVDFNRKIATLATKEILRYEKDEIVKLEGFDLSYLRGESNFENAGAQNYLVFQSVYRYFKKVSTTEHITDWKSKCISELNNKSTAKHLKIVLYIIKLYLF